MHAARMDEGADGVSTNIETSSRHFPAVTECITALALHYASYKQWCVCSDSSARKIETIKAMLKVMEHLKIALERMLEDIVRQKV